MVHVDATYETPLRWPEGRRRTTHPRRAPFRVSLAVARDALLGELFRLGGSRVVIASNARLSRAGQMTSVQPWTADPGVAVWFARKGQELVLACDAWDTIAANLRAIGKTVEAMRGMERWGADQMLDAALGGFAALPERTAGPDPWALLGVQPGAGRDVVDAAYRAGLKRHHPDRGGDAEQLLALNRAYAAVTGASR